MSDERRPPDDPERAKARADLRRLTREGDIGTSHMEAVGTAADREKPDAVERWATLAGRGLAILFVVGLLIALVTGHLG